MTRSSRPAGPMATRIIEGAARHLVADCLDISGARWGLHGAEAVLKLRAVAANGDLEPYWAFHIAAEHQCLYPTSDQGRYTLTAWQLPHSERAAPKWLGAPAS